MCIVIDNSPVLDPFKCHATPGREGSRIIYARAKPIVAHITSTCFSHREIQKLAQKKLFQHAAGKNVGERSYDTEKTCQTELREL